MRITMCLYLKFPVLCVVVGLSGCDSCGGEEEKCLYNGESYAVGESWQAADGCNSCLCLADREITCTAIGCGPVDGGSGQDAIGADAADDAGRDAGRDDLSGADVSGGIDAPITNEIVAYPQQRCVVTSQTGAPLDQPVALGTVVVMDSDALPPPLPGTTFTQIEWSVARAPVGSRTGINAAGVYAPQVAGAHVLRAVLHDDAGGSMNYDCWLEVSNAWELSLELSWNLNDTDMDIHLIKQGADGRFCLLGSGIVPQVGDLAQDCGGTGLEQHCYYANCLAANTNQDWDADQSFGSAGDPVILRDVTHGYGPEVIRLTTAGAGSYLLAGYSYGALVSTRIPLATLRVFSQGQLRAEARQEVAEHNWWEGFVIEWPTSSGGDVCVTDRSSGAQHCGPAPQCVTPGSLCDVCVDDGACGPGTRCELELQRCVSSTAPCLGEAWCETGLACVPATDRCAETECTASEQCSPPFTCTLDTLACVLQPAMCDEVNEPNNSIDDATPLLTSTLDDVLCRGDVDLVQIPVSGDLRHIIMTRFSTALTDVQDLDVSLLNAAGELLQAAEYLGSSQGWRATHDAVYDTVVYLRLQGTAAVHDEYAYQVVVTTESVPDCDDVYEPNETLLQAAAIASEGMLRAVLCDLQDRDYFALTVGEGSRIRATLSHDPALGDADLELLQSTGETLVVTGKPDPIEVVEMGNLQAGVYYLGVYAYEGIPLSRMPYTLQVNTETADAGVTDAALPDVAAHEDAAVVEDALSSDTSVVEDGGVIEEGGVEDVS